MQLSTLLQSRSLNVDAVAVVNDAAVAVICVAEAAVIKYSKQLAKLTYPGGSYQRPYQFYLLKKRKNGQIEGLISNMWLVLLYTVQLTITKLCTKFQDP